MTTPTKIFEDRVRDFMDTFNQKRYSHLEAVPIEVVDLRARLIREEAREYHEAKSRGADELDGICDLIYVVVGTNLVGNLRVEEYLTKSIPAKFWKKISVFPEVFHLTQELDTKFPCPKRTREACNVLLQCLVDIAAIQGYNLLGAFEAVHANNMAKLWPHPPTKPEHKSYRAAKKGDKWLVVDAKGKVQKPDNHTKVDLTPYL